MLAHIVSYPLRKSGAFIWIWMGDPRQIDGHGPPVDMSYTTKEDWTVLLGYYKVVANWVLIREAESLEVSLAADGASLVYVKY